MASLKASQILLIIWASFIAILMLGTPHVNAAVLDGAMPELRPGRRLLNEYNTEGRGGYNGAGSSGYHTEGRGGYNGAGSSGYHTERTRLNKAP